MQGDELLMDVWRAGEIVPPGKYLRVDDGSLRVVVLEQHGPLPPAFDGHVALYCRSAQRPPHTRSTQTAKPTTADMRVSH